LAGSVERRQSSSFSAISETVQVGLVPVGREIDVEGVVATAMRLDPAPPMTTNCTREPQVS